MSCKYMADPGLGTAVHEHIRIHYLMSVLYGTLSLPYARSDIDRREVYLKAYKACEKESKLDTNQDLQYLVAFKFEDKRISPKA